MRRLVAASFGWWLAASPPPDLLPPGTKSVKHELVLEWAEALDGTRFVLSPGLRMGNQILNRKEPFRLSRTVRSRLYAIPAEATLPKRDEWLSEGTWPSCEIPVREVHSTGAGHPLASVLTTLRVVKVENGAILLERVAEVRRDADGNELGDLEWLPVAGLALLGAAWLWQIDRRRRRPAPPEAMPQ